jgi:hypothetical protein
MTDVQGWQGLNIFFTDRSSFRKLVKFSIKIGSIKDLQGKVRWKTKIQVQVQAYGVYVKLQNFHDFA